METSAVEGASVLSIFFYLLNLVGIVGVVCLIVWLLRTLKSNREALKRMEKKVDELSQLR